MSSSLQEQWSLKSDIFIMSRMRTRNLQIHKKMVVLPSWIGNDFFCDCASCACSNYKFFHHWSWINSFWFQPRTQYFQTRATGNGSANTFCVSAQACDSEVFLNRYRANSYYWFFHIFLLDNWNQNVFYCLTIVRTIIDEAKNEMHNYK